MRIRSSIPWLAGWACVSMGFALIGGCHQAKSTLATPADVAAAQADAQKEFEQAKIEARKDVKSAAKVTGGNPKNISEAKAVGAFDVAMAHADGDHKVALETCMTLQPAQQQACKNQADANYQTAATSAKAIRVSQQQ